MGMETKCIGICSEENSGDGKEGGGTIAIGDDVRVKVRIRARARG